MRPRCSFKRSSSCRALRRIGSPATLTDALYPGRFRKSLLASPTVVTVRRASKSVIRSGGGQRSPGAGLSRSWKVKSEVKRHSWLGHGFVLLQLTLSRH